MYLTSSCKYCKVNFHTFSTTREGGIIRLETLIELKFLNRAFRSQILNIELFELILVLKLKKQLPVEQFEASRAIRASSISVSSTLPPSYTFRGRISPRYSRQLPRKVDQEDLSSGVREKTHPGCLFQR